ncbi:ABC transporter, ATP-binding and membrane components [Chlamydia trachomatis RC-L2(s)/46]|uniref:ABC transporter ATP-binding protein n=1 Tax=Chlamydia trachomatis TaxID=813 RepID=UPI00035BFEA1|nr:ABC transporter ATP-binding protein [Chlamydia trachomatis]AGR94600.1 ABC transporter, ATP-binding and membrane components [Chlamydia trachomatis RC-L2(s)/46]
MKLLLKAILRHKKHLVLFGFSLLSILGLTITSQAEIFSLGLIAKTGPDTFLLFGKQEGASLVKRKELSKDQLLEQWDNIVGEGDTLSLPQANAYIAKHSGGSQSITKRLSAYLSGCFDFSRLQCLALFLVVVAILKSTTLFFQRFLAQLIAIRVSCSLRKDYFLALQTLPMTFFHAYDMGNLSSRVIADSSMIALAINALMVNYIQAPITMTLALVVCLSISWKFCACVCLAFPIFILPIVIIAKKVKALAKRIQKSQDHSAAALLDFLLGILTVKVFRTEQFSFSKYCQKNDEIARLEERSAAYSLIPRPLLHTIASLFFALVIMIGLYHFHIPPEELVVFCGLLYLIYDPIKKFADENANIMRGCAAAERFYEVLDLAKQQSNVSEKLNEFQGLQHSIQFCNVSFGYVEDSPVLSDFNLVLKKGEAIGIVGPTGSGKSTIAKLLPRLYEVSHGELLIDSLPIQSYCKNSLRKHIGCVLQHPFLFYDTVWNNLTCGRTFLEEEVFHALKQAHAYEFVSKMPQGVHSLLEESGKNLSGGQQQRLTIARALLHNTSILLLDEATSALDAISENYVKEIVGQLKGRCTQIIIAHKLSTLEYVDRIVYLEQGKKIAEGTKEELLDSCPAFQRMWVLSGAKDWELNAVVK